MSSKYDVISAHKHSYNNEKSILLSKNCICFYCKQSFAKDTVIDWIETNEEKTALCPFCGIDAVIGDASNIPIMESEFIEIHASSLV